MGILSWERSQSPSRRSAARVGQGVAGPAPNGSQTPGLGRLDRGTPQQHGLGSMRILVVDDHEEVLELVGRALERDQHEVLSAATAEQARALLASKQPDLVVLDLGLPDGSGEAL